MEMIAALRALAALSQATRLAVFRLLVQAGPAGCAAGDIAAALGARPNTLSSHLKLLAAAGLIRHRRDGRSLVYSADYTAAGQLIVYLLEDCCQGHAAVCDGVLDSLRKCCAGAPTKGECQ